MPRISLSLRERFETKIDKEAPNGCWRWTSASTGRYGVFWFQGGNALAHRLSYEMHKGPIPAGKLVCHTCDNGHCVNPDHLFLGTPLENMADKVAKGRMPDQRGERNHRSKLTAEQVCEMRELRARGLLQADIAERYGIKREAVGKILRGERWKTQ